MGISINVKKVIFLGVAAFLIVGSSHLLLRYYVDDFISYPDNFHVENSNSPQKSSSGTNYGNKVILEPIPSPPPSIVGRPTFGLIKADKTHDFWYQVFAVFKNHRFKVKEEEELLKSVPESEQEDPTSFTKESLLGKMIIKDEYLQQVKEKHANVVNQLPNEIDPATYKKDSKGVVVLGGGFYSWLAYLAILQLRESGSEMPVELVLPDYKDYENEFDFCETTLPKLNTKCVVLRTLLGAEVVNEWKFGSYQYKILALLVSSFQHVFLLDSDNAVVSNPDRIWDSEVYKKHGLILWPDYWRRSVSPLFYDIANLTVDESTRVRIGRFPLYQPQPVSPGEKIEYHELKGTIPDLSTESGQVIVNKKSHGKMLLVALYYNIFGPEFFYKLLGSGELGTGDKDTFITAAAATQSTYYQVKGYIRTLGYGDKKGYHGMSMAQKDPIQDYAILKEQYKEAHSLLKKGKQNWDIELQKSKIDELKDKYFNADSKDIDIFTLHCNINKIDPTRYREQEDLNEGNERMNHRMFSNFKYMVDGKYVDFEWKRWSNIHNALCTQKIDFAHFRDKQQDMEATCKYAANTINWLSSNSKVVNTH
ncbi:Golgi alpha-1,2 mannosyltransferase [Scheffersomyces xylosifermentans]|uniref:Golgi alpha-1,2 mannosyltransferase n=1 Tax=Scheffersomyces xylosifermentans TaxID=1304137 RepID=UPI00315DFF1F